ncbi:hypothetical protein PSYMO_31872 [Pseudomonas amygdali pv. mori str. 301020]|uniref:Uncharacterized protein n=1 Tax=Pseudomonas amygdali pv. mori str. 301020 TaxID=629261 RepID=A0A656GIV1_PSEA0|nr:hypothetical protein PSYMO_31872 [Pseudomonas amygdali pv. mori str. 301020]
MRLQNLNELDVYQKDRQWVFLYQAFIKGHISNPYKSSVFEIMKDMGVDFMPAEGKESLAESYCTHLEFADRFEPEHGPYTFDEFVQQSHL